MFIVLMPHMEFLSWVSETTGNVVPHHPDPKQIFVDKTSCPAEVLKIDSYEIPFFIHHYIIY